MGAGKLQLFLFVLVIRLSYAADEQPQLLSCISKKTFGSVSLFLVEGTDVYVTDAEGNTALHHAVNRKDTSLVLLFLQLGVESNRQNGTGETPLHRACILGNAGCVALLLKYKAMTHQRDHKRKTALDYAAQGSEDCVRLLLQAGASQESFGLESPLHHAARNGCDAIINLLLNHNAHVDIRTVHTRVTPAFCAAESGHEKSLHLLIKRRCRLDLYDAHGETVLDYARRGNHAGCIALLQKQGSPKVPFYKTYNQRTDDASLTLQKTVAEVLLQALHDTDTKLVHTLLISRAEPNGHDQLEEIPLCRAVQEGSIVCARELLEFGANPSFADKKGMSPLHYAASLGLVDMISLLLEAGAQRNAHNAQGKTPVFCAAENLHTDAVILLLTAGASQRIKDVHGQCPLMSLLTQEGRVNDVQIRKRQDSCIQILVREGGLQTLEFNDEPEFLRKLRLGMLPQFDSDLLEKAETFLMTRFAQAPCYNGEDLTSLGLLKTTISTQLCGRYEQLSSAYACLSSPARKNAAVCLQDDLGASISSLEH